MTNQEILRAIADGKELQQDWRGYYADVDHSLLLDLVSSHMRNPTMEPLKVRVKPEPKPDSVVGLYLSSGGGVWFDNGARPNNMVCTFDGETSELKSVRMIGRPDPEKMEQALRRISALHPKDCPLVEIIQARETLK
jgi:hypothetical protein